MEQKELFTNEKIITQSDRNLITLTNQRIRYTDKEWGRAYIVSILLKNISSIQIRFKSKWYLLLIAVLELLATFILVSSTKTGGYEMIVGVIIGVILLSIYVGSRKHYLTISSKGGDKINFFTKGMKQDAVIDFVNRVEKAILNV